MPDGLEHIGTIIPRALDQWRREIRAGTRTAWTLDALWRAATAEVVARERAPLLAQMRADQAAVDALNQTKAKKPRKQDGRAVRELEAQLWARLIEIDTRLAELDA